LKNTGEIKKIEIAKKLDEKKIDKIYKVINRSNTVKNYIKE
jgi:hypothetical protein